MNRKKSKNIVKKPKYSEKIPLAVARLLLDVPGDQVDNLIINVYYFFLIYFKKNKLKTFYSSTSYQFPTEKRFSDVFLSNFHTVRC